MFWQTHRIEMTNQPEPAANLLANILIRHDFLPSSECDEIVALLGTRTPYNLGVGDNDAKAGQRVLSSQVIAEDIVDVRAMIGALKTPGSAIAKLLAPILFRHRATLANVRQSSDVSDAVAAEIFAGIDGLIADPAFWFTHRDTLDLARSEVGAQQLSYLQARGVLGTEGEPRTATSDALPGSIDLALRWFNITLIEDLALPGSFAKASRLFRRGLDVRQPIDLTCAPLARAFDEVGNTSALAAGAWERARRGDYLDVLGFIAALLGDPAARDAALRALSIATPPDADGAYHLIHLALAERSPEIFQAPRFAQGAHKGRAVISAMRNVQTVEWSDVRARIEPHITRFIDDVALPYYGLTSTAVEDIQLLRTAVDGFYRAHNDSEHKVRTPDGRVQWMKARKRDVSLVYYLSRSSDYDGGSLSFPELGIEIHPEQGMAIAFPSDHRYMHCVREVTRGVRWALGTWIDCAECAPVGTADQTFHWNR